MTVVRIPTKVPSVPTAAPSPAAVSILPFMGSGGGIPVSMRQFIPPNGLAGFAQQTPAVQSLYRKAGGGGARRRKRKSAKKVTRAGVRRVARKAKTRAGSKFTKGSAAAKRHMAKLRKMRKK